MRLIISNLLTDYLIGHFYLRIIFLGIEFTLNRIEAN